uniref:alkaline phosphatase D family protein n=1 Tax=Sphingomonas sp. ACRSK TaxID=2918213 RepID=UPI003158099C
MQQLRFGVAGCQHYEEGWFHAFAALADQELDFLFHYGDYIYEYAPAPPLRMLRGRPFSPVRRHLGGETYSLADYRLRYAQVKTDPDLQRAHAACAWFVTFDDHEIENNWAADRDESGTPPEIFLLRRAAALQAWYEHMPVRRSAFPRAGGLRMHRHASWGRLLDAHFLDTRQYRSDQACGDGDKALCDMARDPARTLLGAEQERWLAQGLARSESRWNLLAQQVLMMDLDLGNAPGAREPIFSMDTWGGYPAARERLLGHIADQRVRNLIVLTGDAHQHFAGNLRQKDGPVLGAEFLTTSATSGGDGQRQHGGCYVQPGDRIASPHQLASERHARTAAQVQHRTARGQERAELVQPHCLHESGAAQGRPGGAVTLIDIDDTGNRARHVFFLHHKGRSPSRCRVTPVIF